MKTTSCGVLVMNAGQELLMCHATGGTYWDIPKGSGEPGESPVQTAIRETAEECGLVFEADELLEIGCFRYRPAKDLHLFATLIERVDTRRCDCITHFRDRFGRMRPEMDGFAWVPLAEVRSRCAKSLAALFDTALPLAGVAQRLQARGRVVGARWRNAGAAT